MLSGRRVVIVVSFVMLTGLLTPGPALGAAPTIERIEISETFPDELLTEECGVAVTTTVEGRIIVRTFEDRTTGVPQLLTINLGYTAASAFGAYQFRDVGADLVRVRPDGTVVVSIIGQVPFEFTGIVKEDGDGNVIFESGGDRGAKQLAAACAALNPIAARPVTGAGEPDRSSR
jgi:hypothetical protein